MSEITPSLPKKRAFARGKRGNFENRKDEILRVAARVFSELGFRQATLEDVADALHVTRPALYHYARSKDELVEMCHQIAREELKQAVAAALRHQSGREQLVAFFRRYAEIICDDFGRCFALVRPSEYSVDQRERSRLAQRNLDKAVRDMVRKGEKDGSLRPVEPLDVSRALFAAFNGIPVWYKAGAGRSPSQIAEDFLLLFLSGLAPAQHRR